MARRPSFDLADLLTPQQVADALGIKICTVYSWAAAGRLPFIKLGKARRAPIRFLRPQVLAFLAAQVRPARSFAAACATSRPAAGPATIAAPRAQGQLPQRPSEPERP